MSNIRYLRNSNNFKIIVNSVFQNDSSGYLSFEPVTLFPFEHRMINYTSLSVQQVKHLFYHKTVFIFAT